MLPHRDSTTPAPSFNLDDYPGFVPEPGVNYLPFDLIPGWLVGDDGHVWSCLDCRGRLTTRWKRLKPSTHGSRGEKRPLLVRKVGGKLRNFKIDWLVLTLFVGPRPDGMEACHGDDNPWNNRVANLRWDTQLANIQDRERRNRTARGRAYPQAKLRESDIPEIFALREQGLTFRQIGDRFGVSDEVVRRTWHGDRWKHVPRPIGQRYHDAEIVCAINGDTTRQGASQG